MHQTTFHSPQCDQKIRNKCLDYTIRNSSFNRHFNQIPNRDETIPLLTFCVKEFLPFSFQACRIEFFVNCRIDTKRKEEKKRKGKKKTKGRNVASISAVHSCIFISLVKLVVTLGRTYRSVIVLRRE